MKFKISTEAGDEAFQRRHCALYCDSVGGDIKHSPAYSQYLDTSVTLSSDWLQCGTKSRIKDRLSWSYGGNLHQKKIIKVQLGAAPR